MLSFLAWLLLLFFCWPLALLALALYPLFWLILLPFRLVGIGVDAVFGLLRALVMLPARAGHAACARARGRASPLSPQLGMQCAPINRR